MYAVSYPLLAIEGTLRSYAGQAIVPERFKPGAFDMFGSSHQIFHILVVMAVVAHLVGLFKAFDFTHGKAGGRC